MKATHKIAIDPLNGHKISEILATLPDRFSTPTVTIAALSLQIDG